MKNDLTRKYLFDLKTDSNENVGFNENAFYVKIGSNEDASLNSKRISLKTLNAKYLLSQCLRINEINWWNRFAV